MLNSAWLSQLPLLGFRYSSGLRRAEGLLFRGSGTSVFSASTASPF